MCDNVVPALAYSVTVSEWLSSDQLYSILVTPMLEQLINGRNTRGQKLKCLGKSLDIHT